MVTNFSSLAVAVQQTLAVSGVAIPLGHTQQLLVASLGYASLAAFQASTEEQPGIFGASIVILDVQGLRDRATALKYGSAATNVSDAIVAAIKIDPQPPQVFLDVRDFIEDVVCRFANETAMDHDAVSSAAANTNAYIDAAYLEATDPPEALTKSQEFWEVPVEGNIGMDQDLDKPFSGDNILVKGVVRIRKAGRVCFTEEMELDIVADVDNSHYDDASVDA